ncbi:MAG: hypothetical protein JNM80_15285 [Phycisphaerae bacterium]|nr:hypothetical protein [Phycisphaerae bacterium]
MSVQDLIELSILDAMGLLDDQERRAFDAAFAGAAPAVQAQVRREQTRLCRIEALLPDELPPAGLRAAVLEAVRREIATADRAVAPPLLKSRGVSPVWRAAAMGLAAAAVILSIATFQFVSEYERLAQQVKSDSLLEGLSRQFSPEYVRDVLFDRDTTRVVFTPSEGAAGQASLFYNPDWREAEFFCSSFATKPGQTLRVAVVDEQGRIVNVLHEFTSSGGIERIGLKFQGRPERIALVSFDRGTETVIGLGTLPGS